MVYVLVDLELANLSECYKSLNYTCFGLRYFIRDFNCGECTVYTYSNIDVLKPQPNGKTMNKID